MAVQLSADSLREGAMKLLAIDPGPTQSGFVRFEDGRVVASGVLDNVGLLSVIGQWHDDLAIEMIASYGMAVGKDVFLTCLWIGRFMQAFLHPDRVKLVYRKDVKMHLCGTPKAKDANIRQALIDHLGPVGTKKNPGPLHGVSTHAWAALGVAVTATEGAC
jgi:hypothetical protein